MIKPTRSNSVINNVMYAFIAQGFSFLLSLLMSVVVPKILGIEEFSYWQLFVFYTTYIGFFHFGLNDGIYLRLGGTNYEELNFRSVGSQFWLAFVFHSFLASLFIIYSGLFVEDPNRQFVYIATAICLPIYNAVGYIGFIFQAVNKTRIFSISVIIDKIIFILILITMIVFKNESFIWLVFLSLFGKLIALFYCIWNGRRMVFVGIKVTELLETSKEMMLNVSVGMNLMFSNIASLLILGSGRLIVDRKWGIEDFGKFSFALTLATFMLSFIAQISMVLFPMLRRIDGSGQKKFYWMTRDILGILLVGILLFYMPLNYVLELWLPEYKESLEYLALLLPLCCYEGKMSLLCSTYFKVLRKEKVLLKINLYSLALSVTLSLISGYLINNIYAVILSMVVAVAFRSIISELYLSKMLEGSILKDILKESVLVAIFILCTWFINPVIGFAVYLLSYIVYLLLSKEKLVTTIRSVKDYRQRGKMTHDN
ncbi:oligosaccharide flippase family protein [Paenibacillus sp. FSL M7-1046]|uniref:oligosaccharide flippase family protein n=1 Tax=Paenibacillus sp. FSL M7-1046 TaxID=2975315 RepID=UPI0030FC9268